MAAVPLALTSGTSQLRVSGVTHAHGHRTFHDAAFGWLPLAERMGLAAELSLGSAAFESEGEGLVDVHLYPAPRLSGLEIAARGLLTETHAFALAANLGIGIALPLQSRIQDRLRKCGIAAQVDLMPLPAALARGIAAVVINQFEGVRVAHVAVGRTAASPENLADEVVAIMERMLERRGALPSSTAEAIVVPLAIAASPHGAPGALRRDPPAYSRVTTCEITGTMLTVAGVLRAMLPVDVQIVGMPGDDGIIEVRPRA
jgi:RNA 3'-terminal phosphate cyclase